MTDSSTVRSRVLGLRRLAAFLSLLGTVAVLLLMVSGFITFGGRVLTVTSTPDLLFYVLDFGARPFISIVLSVGFGILYYVLCIRVLLSVFKMLGAVPLWLASKFDSDPTREAASVCTKAFDGAVFALIFEVVFSKAAFGASLTIFHIAVMAALLGVSLIVGMAHFYVVKRDVKENLFLNICRVGLLVGIVVYAFLVCDADIAATWKAMGGVFAFLRAPNPDIELILDAFINTLFFPALRIIFLFVSAKMAHDAFVSRYEMRDTAVSVFKFSAIFLAIVVVSNGLLCASRDPNEYLGMFLNDALFVLVPAYMFFVSRNIFITVKDASYLNHTTDSGAENDTRVENNA